MESEKTLCVSKDDLPAYLFHQGTNFHAYEWLGCHMERGENGFAYTFRVWAPNADSVSLVGDICDWDNGLPMRRVTQKGVWELTVSRPETAEGTFYKYKITSSGETRLKADPYAFSGETLTKTASIIYDISRFEWHDEGYREYMRSLFAPRKTKQKSAPQHFWSAPLNIYEVHLGSWRTRDGKSTESGENYLNYREIADQLAPYVKKMGYTHVELLPVMEHPYDGSWGYQVCGYYAPTSRFGSPADFAYFVDRMHTCGIGVILDWVPAHFPRDRHGLFEFDGKPLYEYQGADRVEHRGWGTRFFDVGREEVQSFLISNALFWMRVYHADGLRVDAVASMLYLDYDREPGEWVPNSEGNNHNLEAIAFFRKLNTAVFAEFPNALMIAEESTAWPMITKPAHEGGLGFNFKWNMGWANDMFEYVSTDPIFRKYCHEKLTFPLMYAFSENYILPVSHDEVVHGKKSLLDKMFGQYDDKFAGARVFFAYMMTLPGKKLTFMGCEYGQFREWDYKNQLEWFMLDFPRHNELHRYVADLNNLYLDTPALWEIDDGWDGFEWIEADQADRNIISYRRRAIDGGELIVVLNFAPVKRIDYVVRVPKAGKYEEIFNSDRTEFGGGGCLNDAPIQSKTAVDDKGEKQNYIRIVLPPLSAVFLRRLPGRKNKDASEASASDNLC